MPEGARSGAPEGGSREDLGDAGGNPAKCEGGGPMAGRGEREADPGT